MRISDWISDVCSSDLAAMVPDQLRPGQPRRQGPVGAAPPVIDMNDVDPVAPQETGAGQNAAQRPSEFPQGEGLARHERPLGGGVVHPLMPGEETGEDRKSTRLNSSH